MRGLEVIFVCHLAAPYGTGELSCEMTFEVRETTIRRMRIYVLIQESPAIALQIKSAAP